LSSDERLPAAVETTLLRVAQEALTNVRKHVETTKVRVALSCVGSIVWFEVQDRGKGFDTNAIKAGTAAGGHMGLLGMREQLAMAVSS
jgi:signal transduction histidine kinase